VHLDLPRKAIIVAVLEGIEAPRSQYIYHNTPKVITPIIVLIDSLSVGRTFCNRQFNLQPDNIVRYKVLCLKI
jgi:hypothetical protein